MQRLSCPTETVLSNKITTNRTVISFKDSPRKPLGRRPNAGIVNVNVASGDNDVGRGWKAGKLSPVGKLIGWTIKWRQFRTV